MENCDEGETFYRNADIAVMMKSKIKKTTNLLKSTDRRRDDEVKELEKLEGILEVERASRCRTLEKVKECALQKRELEIDQEINYQSIRTLERTILEKTLQDEVSKSDFEQESKREIVVKEMEKWQQMLEAHQKKNGEISEQIKDRTYHKQMLEREQKRNDQTIYSLELQINERSIIVKKLQEELLKTDFEQDGSKNEETLDDHCQQEQQQFMESVKIKGKQEKDQESSQSYEDDLYYKKFDTGRGIIIEGIFPQDFSCDVEPWSSDERLKIINDGVFPEEYMLETDIYYVKGSKAAGSLDKSTILTVNITLKAMLQTRNEHFDYQYKGAVRFDNAWKFYEPQDKDITFRIDGVESFCVISILPEEKPTILSSGSQFICPIDNRIQVRFPPNVVYKEEQISFNVRIS
ncbi:unnamed protein product [Mytilus coruscus]|uniref:Uncharacterized protein n=1 Tax=Mytilus coruscus TaxID=42192 RepID=A0A6J8CTZ9_MYTCO|nr:unnamed protein product [Mytilus coruscus]